MRGWWCVIEGGMACERNFRELRAVDRRAMVGFWIGVVGIFVRKGWGAERTNGRFGAAVGDGWGAESLGDVRYGALCGGGCWVVDGMGFGLECWSRLSGGTFGRSVAAWAWLVSRFVADDAWPDWSPLLRSLVFLSPPLRFDSFHGSIENLFCLLARPSNRSASDRCFGLSFRHRRRGFRSCGGRWRVASVSWACR
ncbi:hypothetical protein K227x_28820 [Rubripirellula lacrimiformis]|uniref:Uncharacterized protein n=1 Tax=Rubripirellula lacrimiformis TaxID=1930273 RepID=A0A517NBJ1_9BACT|nr:hypothetical protein K227x_28820 [Rubripirellula lacrimiformis]